MIVIDGAKQAQIIKDKIKQQVLDLNIVPGIAVIIVGDDSASKIYVANKKKACDYCGFYSEEHTLAKDITQTELIDLIEKLNKKDNINGILCQLPLPAHIDENAVIMAISPKKDVDGFHPTNVGKLVQGHDVLLPCTPAGIIHLLKEYNISISGKKACVIGRSNIVGKPMALLLLREDATVTIAHSKTQNLKEICKNSDIIVCAIGRAKFLSKDMISPNTVVIDVGMNRDENGKLCGDVGNVDAKYITPVPGGVGPMTIAMLMQNTLNSYFKK